MEWRYTFNRAKIIKFISPLFFFFFFFSGLLLFREVNSNQEKASSSNRCDSNVLFTFFFSIFLFPSHLLLFRVIIQLMQIGEVVECWQQGCAVVLFSPTVSFFSPFLFSLFSNLLFFFFIFLFFFIFFFSKGKVECRCILRRSTPQKIEVWMDAASLSLGGKWIKKVSLKKTPIFFFFFDSLNFLYFLSILLERSRGAWRIC